MSFKEAIMKIQSKFKKAEPADTKAKKYERVLHQLIDGAEYVYSTAVKGGHRCLYIYVSPDANINLVKEIYSEMGIELKKHTSHLDNKKREVLYIDLPDIMKLNKEQSEFLEHTAPTSVDYKRLVELSTHKTIAR